MSRGIGRDRSAKRDIQTENKQKSEADIKNDTHKTLTRVLQRLLNRVPALGNALELKQRQHKKRAQPKIGNELRHPIVLIQRRLKVSPSQQRVPDFLEKNTSHRHHGDAAVLELGLTELLLIADALAAVEV